MDERSYGTFGRYSLASSYSYLDGVPFKIGHSFKQPSKVELPSELAKSKSFLANSQYSFETEEAVLAWAKAREDALKHAAEEQAEKILQAAERAQAMTDEHTSSELSDDEDKQERTVTDPDSNNRGIIYDVPTNDTPVTNSINIFGKPLVPPKPTGISMKSLSEPNSILKPIPIQPATSGALLFQNVCEDGSQIKEPNSRLAKFDVSMFEQESDPFNNLELQTINDMEELKLLLEPSVNVSSSDQVKNPTETTGVSNEVHTVPDNTKGMYNFARVVNENKWVTFDDDDLNKTSVKQVKSTEEPKVWKLKNGKAMPPSAEGDYVEIDKKYNKQISALSNNDRVNAIHKTTNFVPETISNSGVSLGEKLPTNLTNSELYKSVLPPIPGSMKTGDDNKCTENSSNPGGHISWSSNPFHQVQSNPFNPAPRSDCNQSTFMPNSHIPASSASSQRNSFIQSCTPVHVLPTPPPVAKKPVVNKGPSVHSSRMWSSVGPSLAQSLDDSSVGTSKGLRNPYSRHSASTTDLQFSTRDLDSSRKSPVLNSLHSSSPTPDVQPINRLRPLPPTPYHSQEQNPPPQVLQLPARLPTMGLSDPYHSLSREAQTFSDNLTSMGFLRARVARAVEKFGQDEKEVLDHLLAVDKLVEKKYAPVLAELALVTYKNYLVKAEVFLEMHSQFEELGFKSDNIRDALVTADMDHDKALDFLTA